MLTGKFTAKSKFSSEDHRAFNRHGESFDRGETFAGVDFETGLKAVEDMRPFVPEGSSMAEMALRWILMFPAVTCAIPGAKKVSQVEDNLKAAEMPPLDDSTMRGLHEIYYRQIRPLVHHYW
jgi:aryl-alcohol dehydrogenase-like predicted oxidoreductase